MKKHMIFLLVLLVLLSGCTVQSRNIIFTAQIIEVYDNGILVSTADDVGFDKANVGFDDSLNISFDLGKGQTVKIEILPEIRESYPVQVTAVKVELVEETETVKYQKISPQRAMEMMVSDAVIVDVRTQSEYDAGHIPNSILIPYDEIQDKAASMLPEKSQIILIYCRSGRRSAIAAHALIKMGYTNVYDFGGIIDWPGEVVKN
jgi:rhodanese-related sulfurtransferase